MATMTRLVVDLLIAVVTSLRVPGRRASTIEGMNGRSGRR